MKVYLDVFFLVNCMMNYLILTLLGMIRRRRLSIRRQAVAAATGSLASVFFFLAGLGRFNSFLIVFYGFVSGILITIAFGRQQARDYIVAVSYTHLDVYKRQIKNRPIYIVKDGKNIENKEE